MKTLTKSITAIALLGTLTLGSAFDADAQLKAISKANDAERLELVNQLKVQLQSMAPQERQQVMARIRAEHALQIGEENGDGEQIRTRTQTRQRTQSELANGTYQYQAGEKQAQLRMGSKQGTYGQKQGAKN